MSFIARHLRKTPIICLFFFFALNFSITAYAVEKYEVRFEGISFEAGLSDAASA